MLVDYSSIHSKPAVKLPPVTVTPPRLKANTCEVPRNTSPCDPMVSVKLISQIGCPAAVAGAGTNSLLLRMLPTVAPGVGLPVYVNAVAVAAAFPESLGTAVDAAEVPLLLAAERLIRNALIVPADVCVPASHARRTRIVFVPDPVMVAMSVALAAEANAADAAE